MGLLSPFVSTDRDLRVLFPVLIILLYVNYKEVIYLNCVCAYELGNLDEICRGFRRSKNINEIHFFEVQRLLIWNIVVSY